MIYYNCMNLVCQYLYTFSSLGIDLTSIPFYVILKLGGDNMNMNETKLDCRIETKVSKSGNEYRVLIIKLTPTCEKQVFLSDAELELFSLYAKANKKSE